MAAPSDAHLLVLLGLRLKGAAGAATLAEHSGQPVGDVVAQLADLAERGLAVERLAAPVGWTLTPAGRATVDRAVAAEVDTAGARPAVADAYRRFVPLNATALETCSRWQVRDVGGRPVRNDHGDRRYDTRVIGDLAHLQRRADPLLDDLAAALPRYRGYGPRLRRAVRMVESGERDWFTGPSLPSYHTVWFELHEDLLATLGLDRSQELVP
ncbi:MAG TPA: hypothetical protein VFW63_02800 [Acidimicrobiales bacterium]|nr:hypothetical protein [Acidimicrobiales bacterium]